MPSMSMRPKPKRILLKLSGEALMGDQPFGIDDKAVKRFASEIAEVHKLGIEIAVVIGGGNIFRGVALAAEGGDRVTGDHMMTRPLPPPSLPFPSLHFLSLPFPALPFPSLTTMQLRSQTRMRLTRYLA